MTNQPTRTATLYRMVMPDHTCPYGLKAKDLLRRQGYEVEDHHLTTREDTDAFKAKHEVKTTPQTFIGGERIGVAGAPSTLVVPPLDRDAEAFRAEAER